MDIHYNAFISYRHHPDDIRAASEIHRSLEHYKVPKAIRKKTNGITRLFRDKEELPITSNLTDDITRALQNSDYLIVICSTHTRESTWVQREIETFLQTHDRSKILTVLVNGEPYDTIPEILLHEDKVDPITGQVIQVPIEPLSCDWRMPRRKAKREELPRLAAALLNCGYNELRQRERQYRTQRMIVAFSAALAICLCFMAYFIYSNMQIQQANEQLEDANDQIQSNLDQALENQSLFLANASSKLLDDGDRLTAIALALEALPEYEGERPYVAQAEMALANAAGAYLTDSEIMAVGAFTCDAVVSNFEVTDDGTLIYIQDDRDVVTVWNTDTFQKVGAVTLSFGSNEMLCTNSGNMLFYDSWNNNLACCGTDGSLIWTATDYDDVAFLDDKNILMAASSESAGLEEPYIFTIRFLDPDTGEEVRDAISFNSINAKASGLNFLLDEYAADMPISLRLYEYEAYHIASLDLDTANLTLLKTLPDSYVDSAGVTDDGKLIVMYFGDDDLVSTRGYIQEMLTTAPQEGSLICFDLSTGRQLWTTKVISYVYGSFTTLETIPGTTNILFQYDNVFHVIDSQTGKILSKCETASSPIWVRAGESSASVLLRDGTFGNYNYAENSCTVIKYMQDELVLGEVCGGAFVNQQLSSQVIVYRSIEDEDRQVLEGDYDSIVAKNTRVSGNLLAIEDYTAIYMFDIENQALLWTDSGDYSFNTEILGFSEDGNTLWCIYLGYSETEIVAYDAQTGEQERYPLPNAADGNSLYYTNQHRMDGSKIYCIANTYWPAEVFYLTCWDTQTQQFQGWEICEKVDKGVLFSAQKAILTITEDYALVWENTNEAIYQISLESGAVETVMTGITSYPYAEASGSTECLLSVGNEIQRRSWDGQVLSRIDLGDKKAVSMYFAENLIYALCDDGTMYRFAGNGTVLSKTELHIYTSFYTNFTSSDFNPSQIQWNFTGNDLILNLFSAGNVIDCTTWQCRAFVPNCVGYCAAQNTFISKEVYGESRMLTFHLYTSAEIMEKAREALGSYELTEDQKAAYGLLEE